MTKRNSTTAAAAAVILAGLTTAGCVAHTAEKMRERAPTLVADSDKPTDVIGPCLVDATDKFGVPSYVPTAHGARLTVQVSGMFGEKGLLAAADIDDLGQHRHVTVWLFKMLSGSANRHRLERVKACL